MAPAEPEDKSGGFFFVNRTASNLNTKDPNELFSILSHAQRDQYKRAREQGMKQFNVKITTGPNKQAIARMTRKSAKSRSVGSSDSNYDELKSGQKSRRKIPLSGVDSGLFPKSSDLRAQESCARLPPLSPVNMLSRGNTEPFNASVLPIDPFTSHLMKIAFEDHASLVWPMETHLGSKSIAMNGWFGMVNDSIGDEACMSSFLGYAAALKSQIQSRNDPVAVARLKIDVFHYRARAIASLRAKIAHNSLTLAVLVVVVRLMCLEAYSYNIEGAKLHFRAAKQIIEGLGGLDKLPWIFLEYIVVASTNFSTLAANEIPNFEVDDWDPGPFAELEKRMIGFPHVRKVIEEAPRATHLGVESLCSPQLGIIFQALREVIEVEEVKQVKFRDIGKYNEIYRWVQMRIIACRHRLRSYHFEASQHGEHIQIAGIDNPEARSIRRTKLRSRCACIGAIFCEILIFYQNAEKINRWNQFYLWEVDFSHCVAELLGDTGKHEKLISPERLSELHILLWATCMPAIISKMQSKRLDVPHFNCVVLIQALMKRLGLHTVEEVKEVCRSVLWSERIMGATLTELLTPQDRG